MVVTPLSPICNLRVCQSIPFDSTYTDTILFSDAASQLAYFVSKSKYSWSNFTPLKMNNKIRIPVDAEKIYDCNYICFQNTNFGNKWFYAFITNIDWVNVSVSEITIELDAWQTWMFDINIGACYVVREHSNTDAYGENVLLEPLEVGEYVNERALRSGHMGQYEVVAEYANADNDPGNGRTGGIFTSMTFAHGVAGAPSGNAVLDFLQGYVNEGKADAVVSTYIMPHDFFTLDEDIVEIELTVPKVTDKLGDYTPRNKKLLCYPYNFLQVSNSQGSEKNYRYEYWDNVGSAGLFTMACPVCANPEILLFPRSYNGQNSDFDNTISISGMPQFAFVIDTYRAWAAQQGNQTALSLLGNLASFTGGLSGANPMAAVSGAMGIAGQIAGVVEQTQMPDRAKGGTSGNVRTALYSLDFYFYNRHIREDYAKVLDDYFDRYGYLTHRLKKPNLTGRPSWNYVQCDSSVVTGSVPLGDINVIKQSLNSGITFWHGDYVGDYSRSNAPA